MYRTTAIHLTLAGLFTVSACSQAEPMSVMQDVYEGVQGEAKDPHRLERMPSSITLGPARRIETNETNY